MSKRLSQNESEMLLYAFRYAITRNSMAILTCTEELLKKWPELTGYSREQFINEIVHAIKHGTRMDETSRQHWRQFLDTIGGKYDDKQRIRKNESIERKPRAISQGRRV